MEIRMQSKLK